MADSKSWSTGASPSPAGQLSDAVGYAHVCGAVQVFGSAFNVTSLGNVSNTGSSSSSTVTLKVQTETFPEASSAL